MALKSNLDGVKVSPITSEDESEGPSIQAIIHHVTGLPKCRLLDKMDVYVQLECGGKRVKTKSRRNNTEKIYYEEDFSLPCGRSKALTVKLIDQVNYSKLTRLKFNDVLVATAYIDFDTVLQSGGNIVRQDFILTSNHTKIPTPKVTLSCNIPREAIHPQCTPLNTEKELTNARRPSHPAFKHRELSPPTTSTHDTASRNGRMGSCLDPSNSTSTTDIFNPDASATAPGKSLYEIPPFPSTETQFARRDRKNSDEDRALDFSFPAPTGDRLRENTRVSPSRSPANRDRYAATQTAGKQAPASTSEYLPLRARARSTATEGFLTSGDQQLDMEDDDGNIEAAWGGQKTRRTPRHRGVSPTDLQSIIASPRNAESPDPDFTRTRRSSAARSIFASTRISAACTEAFAAKIATSHTAAEAAVDQTCTPRRNLSPTMLLSNGGVPQRHTSASSSPSVPHRAASPTSTAPQRHNNLTSSAFGTPQRNQSSPSTNVPQRNGAPINGSWHRNTGNSTNLPTPPQRNHSPTKTSGTTYRDSAGITQRNTTPTKTSMSGSMQRTTHSSTPQRNGSPSASNNRSVQRANGGDTQRPRSPTNYTTTRGPFTTASLNRSTAQNRAKSPRSVADKAISPSVFQRGSFVPICLDHDHRSKATAYIPRKRVAIDDSLYI